jgi:hypothetical protein
MHHIDLKGAKHHAIDHPIHHLIPHQELLSGEARRFAAATALQVFQNLGH